MSGTDHLPVIAPKTLVAVSELGDGTLEKRLERRAPDGNSFPVAHPAVRDWVFGSLFAAVLLAYVAVGVCSIHAPFFALDDWDEINLVRASGSWSSLLGTDLYHFFRPVKNLMFVAYNWLYCHGGMIPVRTMSLAIGLFSALAVFKLCCRLLAHRGWALAATAIWLLSPTLVSSTVWLSASNIMLMTGLAAAAVLCHDLACASEEIPSDTGKKSSVMWTALALLCLFLALTSYEGGVSVVALFVAVDWYLHPQRLYRRATWRKYLLYGLVLTIYLTLRHQAGSTQVVLGGFSNVSRQQAAISCGYLTMLHAGIWLWPFKGMAVIGGYYWGQASMAELAVCYLIVLAATAFAILQRRRYPYLTLGIVWFLLAFAPMSNLLGFRNGPYCDSYIALASVGAAIAFVATLRAVWPTRLAGTARVIALVIFSLLIASRVAAAFEAASWSDAWNDPAVAYEQSVRTFPLAFDAMTELAKQYEARGNYDRADELAAKSIQLAPDRSGPYAVRALIAEREGRIQDALKLLTIYRITAPSSTWGMTFLGDIYANHLGKPAEAETYYRQALAQRPWTQDALRAAYELAYMEANHGNRAEAISLWEQLLVYHPDDGVLHWDLSIAYAQQGDQQRAEYHRRAAKALGYGRQPSSQPTTSGIPAR
ncbi:MAG TPA: tetratricopeptide repeat protein [Verrucomicrobiae bacterium]|nr:tetratricopeptide repeat protein [Verrucomicrobiae bacterium]